jgi:hypothetical protein
MSASHLLGLQGPQQTPTRNIGYSLLAGTPVGMRTVPRQVLEATLTLFQPRRGGGGREGLDCAHHILTSLPSLKATGAPAVLDTCAIQKINTIVNLLVSMSILDRGYKGS